jgi:N-methylhydantoinase A
MRYRIGIDVGGTFTDFVGVRDGNAMVSGKTPSRPGQENLAVLEALRQLASGFQVELPELLDETQIINFGTTVATNAMLEHTGARVGMLTTDGFRDIIELRRGYKESLTDIRLAAPRPIVRRRHRIGIAERIGPDGRILVPLDDAAVGAAVARLRADGVESYAVCFLQAHANPAHERRAAEIIAEHHPEAHVSLSTEVANQIGEFERFSTTLVNAFLSPLVGDYMMLLLDDLRAAGYRRRLLVMQSNGGSADGSEMGRLGAGALLSGPAGGVVAAADVGRALGHSNIIGVDMGGTSYDVSLILGGEPQTRTDAWAARYRIVLPTLDIHTIGAGGGSLAWVDDGGALRVGPQSAGADPGPACYGRGGTRPTVTDADVVLGYLGSENFVGGEMLLDRAAAEAAIHEHVARPLGIDVIEAAVGIARIVDNNMSNGIRYVSVARGHDPRDFALVAFGGAAATHAPVQARDLGISTILVPRAAGVLSAFGALLSDIKSSASAPFYRVAAEADIAEAESLLAELADRQRGLVQTDDVLAVERRVAADFRYVGQVHELTIPVAAEPTITPEAWERAVEDFHTTHEQLYTFRLDHKPVEVITLRQDLIGVRRKLAWDGLSGVESVPGRRLGQRQVWLPVDGRYRPVLAAVHLGSEVQPGADISGPAIIAEANTTIVLHVGDVARLHPAGTYVIEVAADR